MTAKDFFEASKEQSKIKAAIVSKYFWAWAKIIAASQDRFARQQDKRIAYIDLFAGPGRYDDGTVSTPLLVLGKAIDDAMMRERLVTLFNDRDREHATSLGNRIEALPGIEKLRYKPRVTSGEVGREIVEFFDQLRLVPTLFFADPWGYKGLSLGLINSVIKDWGSDCIFFFNYNRINMGLTNAYVEKHMSALFGEARVKALKPALSNLAPEHRELTVVGELCEAIRALGPRFVLPFRFRDDRGTRTSHHLIFVSKHFKGYEIMKEIMAAESSGAEQGVAKFEYNPVQTQTAKPQQLLFMLSRPLEELGDMLLKDFAGKTLTMSDIYQQHNIDRPYIKKNYKQVLAQLENQGSIETGPHRKGTFGDSVVVAFKPSKDS
ncbi:MAG: three-Cys-motif partner protein TcmP [bacterium]|nr:three-Cys-motif partner protein TcmP [bacterium]